MKPTREYVVQVFTPNRAIEFGDLNDAKRFLQRNGPGYIWRRKDVSDIIEGHVYRYPGAVNLGATRP